MSDERERIEMYGLEIAMSLEFVDNDKREYSIPIRVHWPGGLTVNIYHGETNAAIDTFMYMERSEILFHSDEELESAVEQHYADWSADDMFKLLENVL